MVSVCFVNLIDLFDIYKLFFVPRHLCNFCYDNLLATKAAASYLLVHLPSPVQLAFASNLQEQSQVLLEHILKLLMNIIILKMDMLVLVLQLTTTPTLALQFLI